MSATGSLTVPDRESPLPGARLALALLIAINMFNYVDRQVLAAVVPQLENEYFPRQEATQAQGSQSQAEEGLGLLGLLQLAFMVTYMLIAPVFGWSADRFSRWKLIGIGVILWSLASGASGLALTFWTMLLTRCFVGVGEAAYGPAAPTIISDLYPVKIRGKVMAWFYAAIPVGSALGYVLGGLTVKLTHKMGDGALLRIWDHDWSWAFFVVVPPGILLGLLCFFMPEPQRGSSEVASNSKSDRIKPEAGDSGAGGNGKAKASWRDFKTLWHTPSYILDTLGMTAMTFALGGIAFWMPRYIIRERGAEVGLVANATSEQFSDVSANVNLLFGVIVVVGGLIATMLGGIAGDKLRDKLPGSYFIVSGCAMILGFLCFPLILYVPFPWAWGFVLLTCFCLFFNTGPTNTILANVTHPLVRASAFAINILIIHTFGDAISPWLIGMLSKAYSMNIAFLIVSVLILVGGLLWLWGAAYLDRDTKLAPSRLG